MEGKTAILKVFLLSLVLAQGKPQTWRCCQRLTPPTGKTCENLSPDVCTLTPGCGLYERICPAILGSSGAAFIEYCKLGCATSVCNAISTLQISGDEKVVKEAVGQCKNACSAFCTKGSTFEIA